MSSIMSPFAAAFDNLRLVRRKIRIEQEAAAREPVGPLRDAAIMRAQDLTEDLIRCLQDFADMGYEERIASIIAAMDEDDGLRRVN